MSEEQHQVAAEAEAVETPEAMEQEAPQPEAVDDGPSWTDQDADEARALGWKAPDEWKGEKPAGYIDDPNRYLERISENRIFKTLKKQSDDRVAEIERNFTEKYSRLERVQNMAMERQKQQYEEEMRNITSQQRDAVENADVDRWQELEDRKGKLTAPELPAEEPASAPQPDPYVQQYMNDNEWTKNPTLMRAAFEMVEGNAAVKSQGPQEQIAYAEAELRKMYPVYFAPQTQERPKPAQRVDGGGLAGGRKKSAYDALPVEAKTAFQSFVSRGIYKNDDASKKAYADEYNA